MLLAQIARAADRDPVDVLCVVLIVAVFVFAIVGVLQLVNVARTKAPWWAWLVGSGILFFIYYLTC